MFCELDLVFRGAPIVLDLDLMYCGVVELALLYCRICCCGKV